MEKISLKDVKNGLWREEMRTMIGGMTTWCRRGSSNLIDIRPGATTSNTGFLNSNGCWVYDGMPWNANPNCPPSSPSYTLLSAGGGAC